MVNIYHDTQHCSCAGYFLRMYLLSLGKYIVFNQLSKLILRRMQWCDIFSPFFYTVTELLINVVR